MTRRAGSALPSPAWTGGSDPDHRPGDDPVRVRYVDNITATGAVQHLDGSGTTPAGEGFSRA